MKQRMFLVFMTTVLLITLIAPCSAADRWLHLVNDNEGTWYLDTETVITTGPVTNRTIECWTKAVSSDESYFISHLWIEYTRQGKSISRVKLLIGDVFIYDHNGNKIRSWNQRSNGWMSPSPDSILEKVVRAIIIMDAKRLDGIQS